jgi:hypothetical protein
MTVRRRSAISGATGWAPASRPTRLASQCAAHVATDVSADGVHAQQVESSCHARLVDGPCNHTTADGVDSRHEIGVDHLPPLPIVPRSRVAEGSGRVDEVAVEEDAGGEAGIEQSGAERDAVVEAVNGTGGC